MSKKDISKILSGGSARQKTLLLANHIAATSFGKEGFLTSKEFYALLSSIRGERDIRIYNTTKTMELNLRFFLLNLNQLRLIFFNVVSQYVLLRQTITMMEDSMAIKGSVKKQPVERDQDICNLTVALERSKNQLMELIIQVKTGVQLAKDYIDQKGVDIREYKQKLAEIETTVKEHISILLLHRANVVIETDTCGTSHKKKLYNDYNSIEIDQTLYEDFKEQSFSAY
jgi:hypothetical protein